MTSQASSNVLPIQVITDSSTNLVWCFCKLSMLKYTVLVVQQTESLPPANISSEFKLKPLDKKPITANTTLRSNGYQLTSYRRHFHMRHTDNAKH
uniref:Uncharacterized protein n=1 Tax=Strigamia maritima TaxID=126957 RepID=T1JNV5_STRMM